MRISTLPFLACLVLLSACPANKKSDNERTKSDPPVETPGASTTQTMPVPKLACVTDADCVAMSVRDDCCETCGRIPASIADMKAVEAYCNSQVRIQGCPELRCSQPDGTIRERCVEKKCVLETIDEAESAN